MVREEKPEGMGIELAAIVSLESNEGETELGASVNNKRAQDVEHFRFLSNRERPSVMSKIIN
jgi:hypothetical protein